MHFSPYKAAISWNLISALNDVCQLSVTRYDIVEEGFMGHSEPRKPAA